MTQRYPQPLKPPADVGGNIPILLVPGRKDGTDLRPPRNSEYPCGTGLQTAAGRDIDKRWQNRY